MDIQQLEASIGGTWRDRETHGRWLFQPDKKIVTVNGKELPYRVIVTDSDPIIQRTKFIVIGQDEYMITGDPRLYMTLIFNGRLITLEKMVT